MLNKKFNRVLILIITLLFTNCAGKKPKEGGGGGGGGPMGGGGGSKCGPGGCGAGAPKQDGNNDAPIPDAGIAGGESGAGLQDQADPLGTLPPDVSGVPSGQSPDGNSSIGSTLGGDLGAPLPVDPSSDVPPTLDSSQTKPRANQSPGGRDIAFFDLNQNSSTRRDAIPQQDVKFERHRKVPPTSH